VFLFNISATAEATVFKFGIQLGFGKAYHQFTPRGKSGRGPGVEELPKCVGSPSISAQRLKLATANFIHSLSLLRPLIKSDPQEKVGVALA